VYPGGYVFGVVIIRKTAEFAQWIDGLRDIDARARVLVRIERLSVGLVGDVKAVGSGVSELRIQYGPGYRVYFKRTGREIIVLLAGGDKGSQARDIKLATKLASSL
jgi:putative addiction module killer protein